MPKIYRYQQKSRVERGLGAGANGEWDADGYDWQCHKPNLRSAVKDCQAQDRYEQEQQVCRRSQAEIERGQKNPAQNSNSCDYIPRDPLKPN